MSAKTRPNIGRVKFGVPIGNKNRKGYMQTMVAGIRYSLHRLAFIYMTGTYPKPPNEIDHINGDKTDNRWCNLREVSHLDNMRNPVTLPKLLNNCRRINHGRAKVQTVLPLDTREGSSEDEKGERITSPMD